MTVTHSTQSPPSTCSRRRTTSKPSRTLVVRKESLTSIVRRRLDELQPVRFKMCLQFVEEARFGRRVGVKSLPRETCAARELCDFIFQIRPSLKVILCDRGVVNAFVFAKANADARVQLSLKVFHLLPALLGHTKLPQPVQFRFVGQPTRAHAERAHERRLNLRLRRPEIALLLRTQLFLAPGPTLMPLSQTRPQQLFGVRPAIATQHTRRLCHDDRVRIV